MIKKEEIDQGVWLTAREMSSRLDMDHYVTLRIVKSLGVQFNGEKYFVNFETLYKLFHIKSRRTEHTRKINSKLKNRLASAYNLIKHYQSVWCQLYNTKQPPQQNKFKRTYDEIKID